MLRKQILVHILLIQRALLLPPIQTQLIKKPYVFSNCYLILKLYMRSNLILVRFKRNW